MVRTWGSKFDDHVLIGNVNYFYWSGGLGGNDTVTIQGGSPLGVVEAPKIVDAPVNWDVTDTVFEYEAGGSTHRITVDGKFYGLSGSGQNDTLTGDDTDNELKGRDGNDTLTAGAGNDRISFGSGNDLAIGGLGDDTYRYYAKDGFNIIQETGGFDTILFHEEHSEAGWGRPTGMVMILFA